MDKLGGGNVSEGSLNPRLVIFKAKQSIIQALPLIFILLSGIALRMVSANYQWINMDEGEFMADAALLLKGLIPFRDFATREPFAISLFAGGRWLFGDSLLSVRAVNVFFSSATIGLVYLVGKELYNHRVGLLAAALFALSPFIFYWTTIVKLEPLGCFFVTASIYLMIKGIKTGKWLFFFTSGLIMGLSVLSRRSTAVFLIVGLIILIYLYRHNLKVFLLHSLAAGAGAFITFGLPMLWLFWVTDFQWIFSSFIAGEAVVITKQDIFTKLNVFYSVTTMHFPIFILTASFFYLLVRRWLFGRFITLAIMLAGLAMVIAGSLQGAYGNGILWITQGSKLVFYLLFLIMFALVWSILNRGTLAPPSNKHSNFVLIAWFGGYFLFYLFYTIFGRIAVDYFIDFAAVTSVMAAVSLNHLFEKQGDADGSVRPRYSAAAIVSVMIFFAMVFTSVFIYSPLNPFNRPYQNNLPPYNLHERTYDPSFVREVAMDIGKMVPKGDTVFTADTIFAAAAGRDIVSNMTHPWHYIFLPGDKPISYDPFDLYPSISSIIKKMEANSLEYVIAGYRTWYLFQSHPELQYYVQLNYAQVKSYGRAGDMNSIIIYKRSEPSANSALWKIVSGEWDVARESIRSDWGSGQRAVALLNTGEIDSCVVEAYIRVSGEGGFIIRYVDADNFYYIRIIKSPDYQGIQFLKKVNGEEVLKGQVYKPINSYTNYHLKVVAIKQSFFLYLDGKLLLQIDDDSFKSGYVGVSSNYGAAFSGFLLSGATIKEIVSD